MKNSYGLGSAILVLSTLSGCDRDESVEQTDIAQRNEGVTEATRTPTQPTVNEVMPSKDDDEPAATAELQSAEGAEIEGEAKFFEDGDGLRVVLEVEDTKAGQKGVHVHEKADCSDIRGKSMGPHFAPENHDHALPDEAATRHLGDLGNITIGADGKGRLEIRVPKANLKDGDKMSFINKALVVHSGKDSGKSKQPSGDSGEPIACAVIKRS